MGKSKHNDKEKGKKSRKEEREIKNKYILKMHNLFKKVLIYVRNTTIMTTTVQIIIIRYTCI